MRIRDLYEAVEEKRKVLITARFKKDFANFRSMPGFITAFEKLLKHFEPVNFDQPFNRDDAKQTNISRNWNIDPVFRTSHPIHGKAVVAYQLSPTTIKLYAIGPMDMIQKNQESLGRYISNITDEDFTAYTPPPEKNKKTKPSKEDVPVYTEPAPELAVTTEPSEKSKPTGPLSEKETSEIKELVVMLMKDPEDGVPIVRKIVSGDIEEFMQWARITVGLTINDTSRDRAIKTIFGNLPGMQQIARKLLWIARNK